MSFITYPLNNIDYSAEDAELFHCTRKSGIYAESSFPILVSGANNTVTIGKGIAWIKNGEFSGKVAALKAETSIDLGVSDSTLPRIDAVAIQFDANKNETTLVCKIGVASSSPVPPEVVRTERLYELHLYHIYREAGAVSVTWSNVTDLRLSASHCGLMADSVTFIDTSAIYAQINDLVTNYKQDIQSIIEEDLKDAKESGKFDGPQGPKGDPGSDAEVTKSNIESALGYTPADAGSVVEMNVRLEEAEEGVETLAAAVNHATKTQAGSYVGTDTFGSSSPCELTFDFVPKLVMLIAYKGSAGYSDGVYNSPDEITYPVIYCPWLSTEYEEGKGFRPNASASSSVYMAKKSSDGKTISWYVSAGGKQAQYNSSAYEYQWIAFG